MERAPSAWAKVAASAALTVGVSAAWMPLRDHLPNTDLALLLVLLVGALGWLSGRASALVAAICAAVAFDVLDTRPYGALTISRGEDVTTALALLLTGLLVGAGAARLARFHRSEDHRTDALAVMMEVSGLVATGEEHGLVTEAMRTELLRALDLASCEYHVGPPAGARPLVARDGRLVGLISSTGNGRVQIDLPVWSQGEIVAHYRLTPRRSSPTKDELRVALSLADQAGAAMSKESDPRPEPPAPQGNLRLLPASRPETAPPASLA